MLDNGYDLPNSSLVVADNYACGFSAPVSWCVSLYVSSDFFWLAKHVQMLTDDKRVERAQNKLELYLSTSKCTGMDL